MLFKNKKIVIISGCSGIGFSVVKCALAEGAEIIIASRSIEKLTKTKKQLGGTFKTY